jgi:hypothetical protein
MSLRVLLGLIFFLLAVPNMALATPQPVNAWYMYATTVSGLQSEAYNHGCYFGAHHPDSASARAMVLDFGAARKVDSNTTGALDFSNVLFKNGDIYSALKSASDGHHNCYNNQGSTIVVYGNSNYHMRSSGMDGTDAYNAGYKQADRAADLSAYQVANGYNRQSAASGSDMEPSWNGPDNTKNLVDGASDRGGGVYYDNGSADGCPQSGSSGSCNNGWIVADVGYVSYSGLAVPLPQIYRTSMADQWTVVRKHWNANHSYNYVFWGSTGSTGQPLTAREGWDALNARNPDVLTDLSCFGC